ncbi:hypothetical protein [Alkalibacillus haloalkaliphilus]|uniref:Lipoprotein n=1 Tax=Alkalibacillus haloalkaliphilus TaxID=94136 RepID=A0A511W7J2_9BACI|nr:hypothetical protein [Alkalibacillus haloalkaliphilus]GEN46996.1 hypothetical protein AHA02nite_27720 [Alkalibacillus haloalkaliphilus]
MYRLLLFLIMITLLLVACSEGLEENTIKNVKLSDLDRSISKVSSDQMSVHEFNVSEEYNWLEVWVEKYVDGELVEDDFKFSKGVESEGHIIFSTDRDDNFSFNIGITNNGSVGTSHGHDPISEDREVTSFGWTINDEMVVSEEELPLAGKFYINEERRMGFSGNTLEEWDDYKDDYDLAYIVKARFTNEN